MEGTGTVYNLELWTTTGELMADISKLAQQREYTLTRNSPMTIQFQLDLTSFENFCTSINVAPSELISPYKTDVKLKRNGVYIGEVCQVVGIEFNFQPNDTGVNTETGRYNKQTTITEYIQVTAAGYLQIFNDRFVNTSYTNVDSCTIAVDLINQSQQQANGSVGITIPSGQYTTGFLYSPTYTMQNILTELGNLTQFPGAFFDLWIDTDKVLHTANYMGSHRNDLAFTYGGPGSNIIGLYHQRQAQGSLYNEIIGQGSGFGVSSLVSTQNNVASQQEYYLHQKYVFFNNVYNQAQLDQDTAAELALDDHTLDIPQIIITGTELVNKPFIGAGDRIPLYFVDHPFLSDLNGQYFRIEVMDVKIDDNDFEYEITLTMDNYGFPQNA